MLHYIIKRVILAILTIVAISMITFWMMNAIPGGPFNKEYIASPEIQAVLEARYNLEKPLWQQYIIYIKGLLHGDWGVSLKNGRDIWNTISSSFLISARIGGIAAVIAIFAGIILGCIAALKRNTLVDRLIVFFSTLITAIPNYVLATLLLLVFCIWLRLIPIWRAEYHNYVLPVISLAMYPMAYIIRLTKTSMLDVLHQDYIRTARAKGVHKSTLIFKHALRNALIPVITYIGPMTAHILTGSVVIESIFTIGGLGSKFVSSIINRDYTMIMANTIFLSFLIVTVNLVTDILYKIIDPQITLERA